VAWRLSARRRLHIHKDTIKIFTRRGNDWTQRFRKIADDACLINAGCAIIDGEVVVPAEDGTTDFSVLQNELKGKSISIVTVAFDLLHLNGYDVRKLPLVARKAALKPLIAKTAIQFSESFELDGNEMFAHACKVGLEGVVSNVRDSRYASGRGNDWVKRLCPARDANHRWFCARRQRLGRRLSRPAQGKVPDLSGKVGHSFDKVSVADLRKRLTPLISKTTPYSKRIAHKGIWVFGRDRVPHDL